MDGKILIVFLVGLMLLSGCVEESAPGNVTEKTSTAPLVHGSRMISLNESVVIDNISFVAYKWGISPSWRYSPPEGADYLWVYANATNAGNVPVEYMPDKFWIEYRGVTAGAKHTIISGYDLPRTSVWGTYRDKKNYYPGTSNIGYMLFEVPQNLKDNEATFYGTIGSKNISISLDNPIRYKADKVIVNNVSDPECHYYGAGHHQCELEITFQNGQDTPTANLPSLSINGSALKGGPVIGTWLDPYEKMKKTWYLDAYENKGNDEYYGKDSRLIGEPGQKVKLFFCTNCSPQSMEFTLPKFS